MIGKASGAIRKRGDPAASGLTRVWLLSSTGFQTHFHIYQYKTLESFVKDNLFKGQATERDDPSPQVHVLPGMTLQA
jgi:hypothetical protein